jgi:hypothetical protein
VICAGNKDSPLASGTKTHNAIKALQEIRSSMICHAWGAWGRRLLLLLLPLGGLEKGRLL